MLRQGRADRNTFAPEALEALWTGHDRLAVLAKLEWLWWPLQGIICTLCIPDRHIVHRGLASVRHGCNLEES